MGGREGGADECTGSPLQRHNIYVLKIFLCWGFFFVFALRYVSYVFTLFIATQKRVLMGILPDHDLWKDKAKLQACQTQQQNEWR
jgi:hypothetical protein